MISTPMSLDLVRGACELERTARGLRPHRLPSWIRQQFPDSQLLSMETQSAGVRIRMSTTASRLELVIHSTYVGYHGIERPRGQIDVYIDGELIQREPLTGGDHVDVDLQTGRTAFETGPSHHLRIAGLLPQSKTVEIWLPHNESPELVELRTDAPVEPVAHRPLWVHHGSSISQGSNASAPSETWPAIASRRADVDLVNLGFGGSAFADPFMARFIRDSAADVISLKFGINIVNLDGMRLRTFIPALHGFLDTIRDGHPDTPLLLISPLYCGIHEDTPGPGAFDPSMFTTGQARFMAAGTPGDTELGRLTLGVVREAMREVFENRSSDPHLHYLEGTDLYGEGDARRLPLTDNLHPGPEAHQLIGTRFAARALADGGILSGL
ncbi:SGNH/GDSL hydrolase family protein [Actinomycetaceae bacterium L2_0104]